MGGRILLGRIGCRGAVAGMLWRRGAARGMCCYGRNGPQDVGSLLFEKPSIA